MNLRVLFDDEFICSEDFFSLNILNSELKLATQ